MSNFNSSAYRPSVGAAAVGVLTAAVVWGFAAYAGYLQQKQDPYAPVSSAQVESSAALSGRDPRHG